MKLLDEVSVAKIYVNTKLHFDGQIDMMERPVGRQTIEARLKRNDARFFRAAVNEFQKVDVWFDYCIAAFLKGSHWIGDLVVDRQRFDPEYFRLRKVKANKIYHIRSDLKLLLEEGHALPFTLGSTDAIITRWSSGRLHPETITFIERAWGPVLGTPKSPYCKDMAQRIIKYRGFVSFKSLDEISELKTQIETIEI